MDENGLVASLRQKMRTSLAEWVAGKEHQSVLLDQLRVVTDTELHPAYEHALGFRDALRALGADTSDFDASFKEVIAADDRHRSMSDDWWTWRRINEFIEENRASIRQLTARNP